MITVDTINIDATLLLSDIPVAEATLLKNDICEYSRLNIFLFKTIVYASNKRENTPKRKTGILNIKQSPTITTAPRIVTRGGIL
jgi:hypothetical protein